MVKRVLMGLSVALLLGGCMFGGSEERPARPGNKPSAAGLGRPPSARDTQQCFTELARHQIRYNALPDKDYGGGCALIGTVQLLDIGVPVTNIKGMRCGLADAFTAWVRNAVAPAAHQLLGSELVKVESMGTYACRAIIGGGPQAAGRLSEHSVANAIDVAGFVLRDGRRISILRDWRSQDPAVRQFLSVIQRSACRRFKTVLTPEYNAAHRDHLHLDMGRGPFCK